MGPPIVCTSMTSAQFYMLHVEYTIVDIQHIHWSFVYDDTLFGVSLARTHAPHNHRDIIRFSSMGARTSRAQERRVGGSGQSNCGGVFGSGDPKKARTQRDRNDGVRRFVENQYDATVADGSFRCCSCVRLTQIAMVLPIHKANIVVRIIKKTNMHYNVGYRCRRAVETFLLFVTAI